MLTSVIICHHKGNLINKALESLRKSEKVEYEIIIATSVPGIDFKLADKTLLIYGGPAHKRNIASRFANGEFIAFFDDDVEVKPHTLFYLLDSLKDQKVGMVFGKLLNMEFRNRFDEAGSFLTSTGFLYARAESGILDIGQYEEIVPVLSGKSAACMIKKNIFWGVGAFDSSYEILAEETDLSWRVWLYGYQVLYVPQSVTFHAFNTRFKPIDFYIPQRVYFNGCRNYLSMLTTNLSYPKVIQTIFYQLIVWFLVSMGMLLTGKFEAGFYILKGLYWYFSNFSYIQSKRHKIQSSRKVSDKELFKFILKNPPISYYFKRFFHYIWTGRHG